ncbi:GntR family transcriptional regulator [Hazenella sp. IB182357]|uniref:GntR family transcriptional regulator n=1 Tax=Polycladospora coralii TaxID=2771432 RepID=A0A926RTZ0_9BACL|nr:GntR family transcriptional regulator [Polycladospora coralii]MBD1372268.1 GntR family transcriptional regulator [Polycladospora coralii]MBS7530767.1 GntR family transcriptional regulator [Polycladospora coralii]
MSNTKIDKVIQHIKQGIKEFVYLPNQRLPSERELAEELGVSRPTVREALVRLQSENLVDIIPRSGAFIKGALRKQKIDPTKSNNFISELRKQGMKVVSRYLEQTKEIPANEIGEKLNIPEKENVILRSRVQIVDSVPYRIVTTYLLSSLAQDLIGRDEEQIPLFDHLAQKGFYPVRASENLHCRTATSEEAKQMNLSIYSPVIEIERLIWRQFKESDEEILFEYSKIICNAAVHEFHYDYPIGNKIKRKQ